MGVPCQQCGREYDVALFEFGRTIWCTCGSRVGRGPRVRSAAPDASTDGEPRFLADAMLGRLARWLRLLGFDCAYVSEIADAELVRRGVQEGRTILSRDRALPEEWWVPGIHVITANDLRGQLAEVLRHFDLGPRIRLFSRCAACNTLLRRATRDDVAERIPDRIFATRDDFAECPGCGRVYWMGTHTERIRRVVDAVLSES